jgi:hypothetical protein
MKVFLIIVYF